MTRAVLIAGVLFATCGNSPAFAWGCQGHRTVAILAERIVDAKTRQAVRDVLVASPIDPALERFCFPKDPDPIVDAATWADDVRGVMHETAEWHFIDYPLTIDARQAGFTKFCPGGNCVIDAIVTQFKKLRASSDKTEKANALRFLIHFVGDVHQPLHSVTNGDRGGNCVPITYFGETPTTKNHGGSFSPNLHHIWDTETIVRFMTAQKLKTNAALAQRIIDDGLVPTGVKAATPTIARVRGWAEASNAAAKTIGYGKLLPLIADEPILTQPLLSCTGNTKIGDRMMQLHESLDAPYEAETMPVIEKQLALAGQRLAAVLKAAFAN